MVMSPYHPNVDVAGEMTVRIGVPYSKTQVTIEITAKRERYLAATGEAPGSTAAPSQEMVELKLDLQNQKTLAFKFGGRDYEVELQEIGTSKPDNEEFLRFDFQISEL